MNWPEQRLGRVARLRVSNVDKLTRDGERPVRLCNYVDVYKNAAITGDLDFMQATASAAQLASFRLAVGDTVFTKDSETAEDIGVPAYVAEPIDNLVCGYHLAIATPDRSAVDPRFLFWAMSSARLRQQWTALASGITRVGLRADDMTKASVPVPPLDEQRRIADFLDAETARLDVLASFRSRQLDALRARTGSVVEERTLAAGATWPASPLKYLVREIDDRTGKLGELLSVSIHHGVVPRSATTTDEPRAEDLSNYKRVKAGDIVLNRMRAFQGGVGVAPTSGIVSPDYTVMRSTGQVTPRYLHYVFRSPWFVGQMSARLRGIGSSDQGNVRTPRVAFADLGLIPVPVPDATSQRALVRALDDESVWALKTAQTIERQQHLLAERRQALITAAVTGELDVTTAQRATVTT